MFTSSPSPRRYAEPGSDSEPNPARLGVCGLRFPTTAAGSELRGSRRGETAIWQRAKRGFTILEVAMAMAVLTLAIGTALTVLGRGFDSLDSARCISYASQILQSEMEKMRLTSWGNGTTAGTGTSGVTAYPTAETTLTIDTSFYSSGDVGSRMTLTRTAADVHTGMIKVTFKISWTTHDGHAMSRSYTTYYGKNGLYDFFST